MSAEDIGQFQPMIFRCARRQIEIERIQRTASGTNGDVPFV
jgi:hypothetical protein